MSIHPSLRPGPAATVPSRPQPAALALCSPALAPLEVVMRLARNLDLAGIRYCQFKSNCHLEDGLRGLTDLDVLVERGRGTRVASILAETGFRRVGPPPGGDYPGVEDYLAMDGTTGRLLHLHLHHQLTTGERHLKGYRLPWEEQMLATRGRDEASGFPIAEPHLEIVFLLVRHTLKLRGRERVSAGLGRDPIPAGLEAEFRWLRERTERERAVELTRDLLGEPAARAMAEVLAGGPTTRRLLALRRSAWTVLREYRLYHPAGARLHRSRRVLQSLGARCARRVPWFPSPISRADPRGGLLVALLGPDGAGKSRLAADLTRWLGWKLDARTIYFGSGDGPSSVWRWPLKAVLAAARVLGLVPRGGRQDPGGAAGATDERSHEDRRSHALPTPMEAARACWALALAHEKRSNLRRAWRARNQGVVVVCDRYPQDQIPGFNDGPLLHGWRSRRSRLSRSMAEWESLPYRWAQRNPPDIVIRLRVSPEVAIRRKPDMHPGEIARRNRALASLCYPAATRVVDLDADRPLEQVLLDVKREIWDAL